MPFILPSEAKNAYFIHFLASRDEINGIFITKNLCEFSFYYVQFLALQSFALNDVIHVHTLHHINDDVA